MLLNKNTFIGKKIVNCCNAICLETSGKLTTALDENFEYLFFTGNEFDFYIDYKHKQVYIFCLSNKIKEDLSNRFEVLSKTLDDLYLYLEWLKHSQE